MSSAGASISDWYELVEGEQLEQGDVLERCPVFRPPREMSWSETRGIPESGEMTVGILDVIVVSQSCDIASDQKSDMWLVVLCPVWKLSAADHANPFLNSTYGKEECRRGNLPGYHMIASAEHPNWSREISIVSFRELWSLPLDFARSFAASKGPRPRMKSPYREHMSQSLARYFMRVGLPTEVPRFASAAAKAEADAVKALKKLDDATLNGVLAAFQPPSQPTSETPSNPKRWGFISRWFGG